METSLDSKALKRTKISRILGWEAVGCYILAAILFFLPISFKWVSRYDVRSSGTPKSFFDTGMIDSSEWSSVVDGTNLLMAIMIGALVLLVVGALSAIFRKYFIAMMSGVVSLLLMSYMMFSISQYSGLLSVSPTVWPVITVVLLAIAVSTAAWKLATKK